MNNNQLVIKIILIAVFAILALFLLLPGRGVRHVAIRRLTMVGLFVLAILAIIFPGVISQIANAVGVGRGADLLLYGLIIVFVANAVSAQRRHRLLETEMTALARSVAIARAPQPWDAPGQVARPGDAAAEVTSAGRVASAGVAEGDAVAEGAEDERDMDGPRAHDPLR